MKLRAWRDPGPADDLAVTMREYAGRDFTRAQLPHFVRPFGALQLPVLL